MDYLNPAKTIRYGPEDEPNRHGFTRKMSDIWDLVEAEKPLEEAKFEPSEDDRLYYEHYKWQYEMIKERNGKPYKFPRFTIE